MKKYDNYFLYTQKKIETPQFHLYYSKKSDNSSGKQMQSPKLRDLPMISEKSGTPSEVSGND